MATQAISQIRGSNNLPSIVSTASLALTLWKQKHCASDLNRVLSRHVGNGWELWSLPFPLSVSCCRRTEEDTMPELGCGRIHSGDNVFSSALQSPAYTVHWGEIHKGHAGSKSFWQHRMEARNSQRKYNTCYSYSYIFSYIFSYISALGHCQRHKHLIQRSSAASIVQVNFFCWLLEAKLSLER